MLTQLEKKNLDKYKIAIELFNRSLKSKDLKGYDDSILYAQETYGISKQMAYQYRRACKFLYFDTCTCMLDNKFTITQLVELSQLAQTIVLQLYKDGEITHYMTCQELRHIVKNQKPKEKNTTL